MELNPTRRWTLVIALIALITLSHLLVGLHHVGIHNVFRRLFYVPIVIAAFGGVRGGVAAAAAACVAYAPHAFFAAHRDPAPVVDKGLEMALFVVIGALVGWFADQRARSQRRLEAALRERDALEVQLVRAGKLGALGHLAAGLAHELRNPLATIQGSAEALASEFPETHRKHRISQLQLREIERMGRVIRGVLEFARPSPPRRQRLDLATLAHQVGGLFEQGAGARLEFDGLTSAMVEADPDQSKQVLLNLLVNARQALKETGTASAAIRLRLERRRVGERDLCCLGVQDNGPGIPAGLREKIFDPYFTTRAEGTGLGLTISSRIMEAHGGFIDVDATPGVTTVWVCFPCAQERA